MAIVGVKALVDQKVSEIPKKYIRPPSLRPANVTETCSKFPKGVPVIDISELYGEGESRKKVVEEIASAAGSWGMFQVINHGIDSSVVSSMSQASHEFFDLPIQDKMQYYSEDFLENMRFSTSHQPSIETHHEWQDSLQHSFPPFGDDHPWPEKPSFYKYVPANKINEMFACLFRSAAQNYLNGVMDLGKQVCSTLSEGLGLEPGELDKALGGLQVSLRLNYYPPCPKPELALGLSPHSDFGGFTIIMQDEIDGLQVRRDGRWYLVKPVSGAFVVNISDQLQVCSNGIYKSSKHRAVTNYSKTRLSVAVFFEPPMNTLIKPIPKLDYDNHRPFKSYLFGDYLTQQFSNNLGYDALEAAGYNLPSPRSRNTIT